jgi:hypothetical protein
MIRKRKRAKDEGMCAVPRIVYSCSTFTHAQFCSSSGGIGVHEFAVAQETDMGEESMDCGRTTKR